MSETAENQTSNGLLSNIWDKTSGFFGHAEEFIGETVDSVKDFFNEKSEMLSPMNWLKDICEALLGKETVHNVVHSITDFFDGDGQEAFGSGTFLESLENWETELATEIAEENQALTGPSQPQQVTPQL